MQLPCEMIRDLLPLYYDGVCSEVSQVLVTAHLKDCPACRSTLETLSAEIEMPKLDADEAKPLKAIRRKNLRRSILIGLAMFAAVFCLWYSLTQNCAVRMTSDEFTVHTVVELSNGMCYIEYSHPYTFSGACADIHRTDDGEIHLVHYRPRVVFRQEEGSRIVRNELIDPNGTIYSDNGAEVPHTAFYLGCPDDGDALLVWSADMDVPMAAPDVERHALVGRVFK